MNKTSTLPNGYDMKAWSLWETAFGVHATRKSDGFRVRAKSRAECIQKMNVAPNSPTNQDIEATWA